MRQRRLSPELQKWATSQIAPIGRFSSIRKLAEESGLSQGTVNAVITKGKAEPETLIDLAKTTETPVTDLFVMAGWLTPEDVSADVPRLTRRETDLVDGFRNLPDEGRRWMLGSLQGMLGIATKSD